MKYIALCLTALFVLTSCGGNGEEVAEEGNTQTANPASEYCVAQGGTSEIRENEDGSKSGVCIFADGSEQDEWEYFRANNAAE